MVKRFENDYGDIRESLDGPFVMYEDYAALKAHADAMCEAMCLYDLGERVSFQSYRDYAEWRQNDNA